MDAILTAAVSEVALEGSRGCSVPKLWKLLEERLHPIPDALRPHIWRQLGRMPEQIGFTTEGRVRAAARCAGLKTRRKGTPLMHRLSLR